MNGKANCGANQGVKIGIIIPIYNVAKYLRQCLDLVLNQTYGNFYVVLINDGSTDILQGESKSESLKIALEYVAKDSRFVLFDKANGGLSSARNVGIDYFSGKCNSSLTQSSRELEKSTFDRQQVLSQADFPTQPTNLTQDTRIATFEICINATKMTCYANPNNANLTNPKIDYIIFLDSDDWWEVNLLEKCVEVVRRNNADIVWFSWKTFYDGLANPNGGGRQRYLAYYLWIHARRHY